MLNSFVSTMNSTLSALIARCVVTAWHYPIIGAMFLAGFFVLTVLLWIAVIKETAVSKTTRDPYEDAKPMRLRRG